MQRARAREILLAGAFVLCACKKPEPVQEIAPTDTGAITVTTSAPSVTVTPLASATPNEAESAVPHEHSDAELEAEKTALRKKALEEAREFGMIGILGTDAASVAPWGREDTLGTHRDGGATGSSGMIRQGTVQVNGRLPPEVIQRIVRQNFGRFRLCYQNGLRSNPSLQGRVAVKYVIDRDGSVKGTPNDAGSDLPDQGVVQCVIRAFQNLSYPQPEGGIVTVVFPLVFSPSP